MSGVSRTETVAVTGAGGLVGQGDPEGAGGEGGQGEVGGYGRAGGDDDAVAGGRRVAEGAGGQVVGAGGQGEGVAARRVGRRQAAAPVAVEGRGDGRAGDGGPVPGTGDRPLHHPGAHQSGDGGETVYPAPAGVVVGEGGAQWDGGAGDEEGGPGDVHRRAHGAQERGQAGDVGVAMEVPLIVP